MTEFLTANWLWILLGIGALWFFTRGHGMGCGMGGHSHGEDVIPHAGHASGTRAVQEHATPASAPPRQHGGCC